MLKKGVTKLIAEANAVIDTVAVHDAIPMLGDEDVAIIDIRDDTERAQNGEIPRAIHAPRGLLEFLADPETALHKPVFSSGKTLLLFCATGGRSTLAAKTLMDMGLSNVAHIGGGFAAWLEAGGPVDNGKP